MKGLKDKVGRGHNGRGRGGNGQGDGASGWR